MGQRPRQESNLVCDLRKVACLHHTPRTGVASILARSRTGSRILGEFDAIPYTTRTLTRADGWVRTSILRLTRSAPFCIEPRRQTRKGCPGGIEPCRLDFHRVVCLPLHYRHHRSESRERESNLSSSGSEADVVSTKPPRRTGPWGRLPACIRIEAGWKPAPRTRAPC